MNIKKSQIVKWIKNAQQLMVYHQKQLTELDTAIGDGDHGLNMQRGFTKAVEKIALVEDKDIGTILKNIGMTLLSQVGGASGPLYGTFFIKGAAIVNGKEELNASELIAVLKNGVDGIVARGRAELGDKTMCDVWLPVIAELEQNKDHLSLSELFEHAVQKAQQSLSATIPMVARKGRASYLGERSSGHADPGATSSTYLLIALRDALN